MISFLFAVRNKELFALMTIVSFSDSQMNMYHRDMT